MNSIKLGALAAALVAGQALGASTISYTLELGGNNKAAQWKNPAGCSQADLYPKFEGGSPDDTAVYTVGAIITWSAKVDVSGTIGETEPVKGAANLVINLQLLKDGQPADVSGAGGTQGKWLSTINNGVAGTRQTTCLAPADPLALAAFPVAWSIDAGAHWARIVDGPNTAATAGTEVDLGGPIGGGVGGSNPASSTGPSYGYWQYPSASGFPANSTAPTGSLLGMGVGYANYIPFGCPAFCGDSSAQGLSTAGIGLTTGSACAATLGRGPAFEGQIDTSGLPGGTYVLVLTPGTGNNVLRVLGNEPECFADVPTGGFAVKADTVTGDTITFRLEGGIIPPTATIAGRHLFYQGSSWGTAIATDKTPKVGSGVANFANVLTHSRGITGIFVDVANLVGTPAASNFEVRTGTTGSSAGWALATAPTVTLLAGAGTGGSDRIQLTWANNALPNPTWLRVKVSGLGLAADDIFYVGSLIGDTGSTGASASVTSADYNGTYAVRNTAATIVSPFDFDRSKAITSADYNLSYARRNNVLSYTINP